VARLTIAASLACADPLRVLETIETLDRAGIDMIHVDLMDGQFVPNLGLGFQLVESLSDVALPVDVHLMVIDPERFVERLADANVATVTVHVEACERLSAVLRRIRAAGLHAGVACAPTTPVEVLTTCLDELDRVVVMGVRPGFAAQRFLSQTFGRVGAVVEIVRRARKPIEIQVDGGIGFDEIACLREIGATEIVAGTHALFFGDDLLANARRLRGFCDGDIGHDHEVLQAERWS
jgi:ribulose-phosphate 3-epimerase